LIAIPQRARQVGWFVALWCAGVLAVGAVGLVIRFFLA
jgi:hypothetical protein